MLAPLLMACSKEPAHPDAPAGSVIAATSSMPAPSVSAAASASGGGAASGDAAGNCHPTDPKLAKFWKPLTATELNDLLKGHVDGAARPRAGCALGAFMSTTNILSFEASAPPKLLPLEARWKGGDKGKKAPPLVPNLAGVLPKLDSATPLVEEDFEDGEGNFFTRRVYRASDGSYFLVLDYAG
ncbi:MAG: hypothetical protein KC492_46190 [Myxococcales bacterium]|nr:hypothetical protein [Myxococcales bacterium]